jgi:type IV secretion system protein VirB10
MEGQGVSTDEDVERLPIDDLVRGERGVPSVSRERSLQSRASSVLAGGLTVVLGVAALTWYYANALTRPARARDAAQTAAAHRAQGEMALPSIGRIDPPTLPATSLIVPAVAMETETVPRYGMVAATAAASQPAPIARVPYGRAAVKASPPLPPPVDRRLAGAVFVRQSAADVSSSPTRAFDDSPRDDRGLAQLLRPTPTTAVQAKVLPTRRFLLPKGSFIDCTLETAIDSTLPGMTTCVAATDTYSADGSLVLLERGTQLVGETRGEVRQGAARVFVLWTEARTPSGVVVPLDSPGTDELGRSGLEGTVDRHFWERFGSAILVTAIDGAVQAAVQPASGSGGTIIMNPSASQEVLTEVLRGSMNIPPTVRKSQGDRIQVLVARDVDFRTVYELGH